MLRLKRLSDLRESRAGAVFPRHFQEISMRRREIRRRAIRVIRIDREELEREARENDMTVEEYEWQLELRESREQDYRDAKGWR